ncbi:hypothetical protein GCM10011571_18720 [Marinithermofilum abyssi]|uniref:Sporulation membrane protein YtrI C-terminal domain-containing protein n=2 Tax=Marinithermofilum abyssi TaxID=1571185 RepID=A0A8J2VCV9_9BACL|nr:hypothetical protein GCM10011571_18720 [Marinithermofilum abyssi]
MNGSRLRLLVSFILGILCGAVWMTLLYGQTLDGLYLERDAIYYANNQKLKEIQLLQQELNKYAEQDAHRRETSSKIQKIAVEVESSEKFGQELIKEKVEEIVEPFRGKSVEWVSNNPDVLDTLFKERTIRLSEQNRPVELKIELKYLAFIDNTLKIWVKAREISEKGVTVGRKRFAIPLVSLYYYTR